MTEQAQAAGGRDRLDHKGAAPPSETGRTGGQEPGASRERPSQTETLDRDALHQADYGGAREDAPAPEDTQQGGTATDDATGGGRELTVDRDRDYDPDGDRAGL